METGCAFLGLARVRLAIDYAPALLMLALITAFYCARAEGAYTVHVEAPNPLRKILEQFLDLVRYRERKDLNEDQFKFMLGDAEQQVKDLAATEGYFSPRTQVDVDRAGATPVVHIKVEPGPRTLISNVNLNVAGAATA